MTMIKDFLQSISNVEIFAIISLLIILASFLVVLVYTFRIKKEDLNKYSRLPLDEVDILWAATVQIDNNNNKSGE